MHTLLSLALLATPAAPLVRAEPRPVIGDSLLPGSVAKFGPTAFSYAGLVSRSYPGRPPNLCYSPDGTRVAVVATSGAYIWDVASGGRLLYVPAGGEECVGLLGFDTTGDVFVTCWRKWDGGAAGAFRIDVNTGKVKAKFQPDEKRRFTAISPDGKVVFSRTSNETVANELATGKEVWRREMKQSEWVRLSPDGSRLVVWTSWAIWSADVLDSATGKTLERFGHPDHGSTPYGIAVGWKADRVVSAHAWDRGFSVFESGAEKPALHQPGKWYTEVFLTTDAKRAVFLRQEKGYAFEVWDLATKKQLSAVTSESKWYHAVTLSPDAETLALAGERESPQAIQFFSVKTGKRLGASPTAFKQAEMVWYLPDGTLASAEIGMKRPVQWDAKTGRMTELPADTKYTEPPKMPAGFKPPEGTTGLVVAPGGTRVFGYRFDPEELDSSPGDTYLGLFDETGKLVKRYLRPDHTNGASYRFSADGKVFAISRGDGTLTFHDATTGEEFGSHRTAGGAGWMAFSPDGKHLALTGGDAPIVVWTVPTPKN